MKTNKQTSCHVTTKKIAKKLIGNTFGILLLFFFLGIFSTSAVAQNSCLITGYAPSAPYPIAVIEKTTNSGEIQYRATSSVPSTYLWTITDNTSGAIIMEKLDDVVNINAGNTKGSFRLTCTVTSLEDPTIENTCTISVAVKSN